EAIVAAAPFQHLRVIAGPVRGWRGAELLACIGDQITVRIEHAHRRNRTLGQGLLPLRLAQQALRKKDRRRRIVVAVEQWHVWGGGGEAGPLALAVSGPGHASRARMRASGLVLRSSAMQTIVETIRVAARSVPARLPATFDAPPMRRRHGTGISSVRNR